LVVRAKTGRPGPAYYHQVQSHRYDIRLCGGEDNFHEMQKQLLFNTLEAYIDPED
jgi:hypothetical protein